MAIEIIPINGRCPYFDYNVFEQSVYDTLSYLGNTCKSIKIFLLNNFPVPISNLINIDLLLIIVVEKTQGNYYIVRKDKNNTKYLYNQIIPIKFITDYQYSQIYIRDKKGEIIYTENAELDFSTEINVLKNGLSTYLKEKVELEKLEHLYINPLIFIKNQWTRHVTNNYLVANYFTFENLNYYFWKNEEEKYFNSYSKWKEEGVFGLVVDNDIKKIITQAAKDSKYGYLTKKKIDLLTDQIYNIRTLREEIEAKKLISIEGKAGTGKTNRLLSIAQYCLKQNKNVLFLTYNKLLVYDISLLLQNNKRENTQKNIVVTTFHSFFFNICRKTGVIKLIGQKRYEEIVEVLKISMAKVYEVLKNNLNHIENLLTINRPYQKEGDILKTFFQNHKELNETETSYAIEYTNFNHSNIQEILKEKNIEYFIQKKEEAVNELYFSENKDSILFFKDYEEVLRVLYKTFSNFQEFYDEYKVNDSYELLNNPLAIESKRSFLVENGKIPFNSYKCLIDEKKSFFCKYDVICIDEAQDCENIEKELLLYLFKGKAIAIANGGQEQLVRYGKLCNWESPEIITTVVSHTLRKKSLRTKAAVIDFCNFIAEKGGIKNFNLEPLDSEDQGQIIFDFRTPNNDIAEVFLSLKKKGELNHNSTYESILTLIMPEGEKDFSLNQYGSVIKINENNYIEENNISEKKADWYLLPILEDKGIHCYSATRDKSNPIFSFEDMRIMHYESCRGLEAWSVCCFSLNDFFYGKYGDEKAERYLLNEKRNDLTNEMRKIMYATTWVLMALTRAMDTLYIQLNKPKDMFLKQKYYPEDPIFESWVEEYISINQGNNNIKVIR